MESVGLLSSLRRHLGFVIALTLLGLLIAILASTLLPRTYDARATLFLRVQAASTSLYERSQFALQRVQSYPQLLDSPTLLESVIAKLDLQETTGELASQVSAENPTNTVLLNVTATADTPQVAASIANAAAQALASNVNTLENSETASKNAVTLVQQIEATTPRSPSSPNLPVVLGLGVVIGFVLGALIALLLERFRPRIRTASDVRRIAGLPVVAELPRGGKSLPAATANAAVNLRAIVKGRIPQLLVLAPADRRAARSGAQLLLAWGLAQTGRRVLAVAAPTDPVGDVGVDVPAGAPGASEVLAGRKSISATQIRAEQHGFDVLPTGDVAVAPTSFDLERVGSDAIAPLVTGHDVTVLQAGGDSRPLDLETAGRFARATLLVVARRTPELELRRLVARVRALDVLPIGVIITDVGRASDDLLETWTPSDFVVVDEEPIPLPAADAQPTAAGSTAASEDDATSREVVEVGSASDGR